MNAVVQLLLVNLDEAYAKHGWHGPTLRGALRGLSIEETLWRPAPGRHNIWELTAHAAFWKYTVRRRLRARTASFPLKGSDFFAAPPDADARRWKDLLAILDAEHRQLREVIASFTDEELRDVKKVRMAYGVAAHDVYHAGQIQLIRRLRE